MIVYAYRKSKCKQCRERADIIEDFIHQIETNVDPFEELLAHSNDSSWKDDSLMFNFKLFLKKISELPVLFDGFEKKLSEVDDYKITKTEIRQL
jgi:hypothetical protein